MIDARQIKEWISQGEGVNLEFKESFDKLSRSAFETVCAMLNRRGGHILLGVTDKGYIQGVNPESLQSQLDTLAKDLNNPQVMSPTCFIQPDIVEVDGKNVICINVPESTQVHAHKGIIYDRNEDGDMKLSNYQLIANLYVRKQRGYTEDEIKPQLRMEDFEDDTFAIARNAARISRDNHPWLSMTNEEILRSSRMYLRNERGDEGFTLAAALLFGKPNTIAALLPHYKTDAIYRHSEDMILYDDRDVMTNNLINTYLRLMDFCRRHIDECPYLDGNQRVSLREIVMREIVGNLCVHREFSSAYPATLEITTGHIQTRNWNIPHFHGFVSWDKLFPFPKNPVIASVFREKGWAEELGAGMRNLRKYAPLFSGIDSPLEIEDADIFRITVRKSCESRAKVVRKSSESQIKVGNIGKEELRMILKYASNAVSFKELVGVLGYTKDIVRRNYLHPMLDENILQMTMPDKPQSRLQRYTLTGKGHQMLLEMS